VVLRSSPVSRRRRSPAEFGWHLDVFVLALRPPKVTETVIDNAALSGRRDILHRQMDNEEPGYLQKLKRHAFVNGIDLIRLSIHQDFVSPDAEERKKNIDHTIRRMSWPTRWGSRAFDLIRAAGKPSSRSMSSWLAAVRSRLAGFNEDDAFGWCIDSIEKCMPKAASSVWCWRWRITGAHTLPKASCVLKAIPSPWLGINGHRKFPEDPHDKLKVMAPHAVFVQAKTGLGGGEWLHVDLTTSGSREF
jgi:hypothetical protein